MTHVRTTLIQSNPPELDAYAGTGVNESLRRLSGKRFRLW